MPLVRPLSNRRSAIGVVTPEDISVNRLASGNRVQRCRWACCRPGHRPAHDPSGGPATADLAQQAVSSQRQRACCPPCRRCCYTLLLAEAEPATIVAGTRPSFCCARIDSADLELGALDQARQMALAANVPGRHETRALCTLVRCHPAVWGQEDAACEVADRKRPILSPEPMAARISVLRAAAIGPRPR